MCVCLCVCVCVSLYITLSSFQQLPVTCRKCQATVLYNCMLPDDGPVSVIIKPNNSVLSNLPRQYRSLDHSDDTFCLSFQYQCHANNTLHYINTMNYNSACSAWVTNPSLILKANTEGAEQNTWIYTQQQESYETETK